MRPRKPTSLSSGVGAFQSRRAAANEASRVLTKNWSSRCFLDVYRSLSSRIRRGVSMILFVPILLLFIQSSVPSRNDHVISKRHKVPKPQVCSHQLLNPPPLHRLSPGPPADGSLQAMRALWSSSASIRCFDVDAITLRDGTLLAAHPRRLAKALAVVHERFPNMMQEEASVHENTGREIYQALTSNGRADGGDGFPFPDLEELLWQYASLVNGSHPFFDNQSTKSIRHGSSRNKHHASRLKGPVLNLDLKQGPYLTKDKLLSLAETIHQHQLEDFVAVCVTPLDSSDSTSLDMLNILHEHNVASKDDKIIPLGLVLRDLVPKDQDVSQIRQLARHYAGSIRLLVPSFKFPASWYQEMYRLDEGHDDDHGKIRTTNVLSQLPMTAWTIDTREDYEYASGMNVSAVVANRPLDFL